MLGHFRPRSFYERVVIPALSELIPVLQVGADHVFRIAQNMLPPCAAMKIRTLRASAGHDREIRLPWMPREWAAGGCGCIHLRRLKWMLLLRTVPRTRLAPVMASRPLREDAVPSPSLQLRPSSFHWERKVS